ncbi:hypothetical protein KCP74_21815 [Salmonella enterica subsp. enterica]|nr:hypothetical protein KCP74_21815 [Salmonella enterica subsp. enterica]
MALLYGESVCLAARGGSITPPKPHCWFCAEPHVTAVNFIDCQVLNNHTASLGAIEIPRRDYLDHLATPPTAAGLPFLGAADIILPGSECFRHIFIGVL